MAKSDSLPRATRRCGPRRRRPAQKHWWRALALAAAVALAACASPAERFDRTADGLGLKRRLVAGDGFEHAVFFNPAALAVTGAARDRGDEVFHLYLGSDGTPALGGRPAADPTPRNPLMLRLMAEDPAPAAYIGRPCYHGTATDAACADALWTTARYAEEAVASLAAVVRRVLAAGGERPIVWFGYSGGGALAMLLAERFPRTEAVITVAADLDIDAWADHHGYARLTGSLNPAERDPLPDHVRQIHYAGSDDRIVPPAVVVDAVRRRGGTFIVYEGFNHVCCWQAIWPQILAEVATQADPGGTAGGKAGGRTGGAD